MNKLNKVSFLLSFFLIIIIFFCYEKLQQDDAYIFYTYSKNIATGYGYFFNIEEKVNATTSPFYTILLSIIYLSIKDLFPDSLPVIGHLVGIFSLFYLTYLLRKFLNDNPIASILCPLLFLANPLLKFGTGMETFLNLAMISTAIYFYWKEKYNLSALFAALSVLTRIDSILLPIIMFFYYTIKNKKMPPIKSIAIFVLTIIPWLVFSLLYFESILPTTIYIKLKQPTLGFFGEGLIFIKGLFKSIPGTIMTGSVLILLTVFSAGFLYHRKKFIQMNEAIKLILLWSFFLFIVYAFILNAPPYPWYYTPFSIAFSIIFSISLSELPKLAQKKLMLIIIIIVFISGIILPIKTYLEGYNPKYIYYKEAANWLNKNVKDGSVVAVDEPGIIGYYYKKGKIIDVLGLITPEVTPHLLKNDFGWFIKRYEPEYIVNDYPLVQVHIGRNDTIFQKNYAVVKIFDVKGEKIAIYKRISFTKVLRE